VLVPPVVVVADEENEGLALERTEVVTVEIKLADAKGEAEEQ
jgi:hypothetical protein